MAVAHPLPHSIWQSKMSPDHDKCLVGSKIIPRWKPLENMNKRVVVFLSEVVCGKNLLPLLRSTLPTTFSYMHSRTETSAIEQRFCFFRFVKSSFIFLVHLFIFYQRDTKSFVESSGCKYIKLPLSVFPFFSTSFTNLLVWAFTLLQWSYLSAFLPLLSHALIHSTDRLTFSEQQFQTELSNLNYPQ